VLGLRNGQTTVHDVATGECTMTLGEPVEDGSAAINCVRTHATLSLVACAKENRTIDFYDLKTGALVHTMIAHQSAVGAVSFDGSGLYMVSTGHDRSVRIWDIGTKACVFERTLHRPKGGEAINAVVFHKNAPHFATGGADSTIKIFA
jgi:striatin 1/3/4